VLGLSHGKGIFTIGCTKIALLDILALQSITEIWNTAIKRLAVRRSADDAVIGGGAATTMTLMTDNKL
jgi:hypothetical protein